MMIARIGVRILAAISLLLSGPQAFADTDAEIASQSERALTSEEFERLETQCPLAEAGEVMPGFPDGLRVVKVDLPAQRLLPLVVLKPLSGTEDEKTRVSRWDDLPKGGIGRRDFCEAVSLTRVSESENEKNMVIFALRLRPQLELQKDYPEAYDEMMRRDQYILMGAGSFAYIKLEKSDKARDVMAMLAGHPAIPTDVVYIKTDHGIYIQLTETDI